MPHRKKHDSAKDNEERIDEEGGEVPVALLEHPSYQALMKKLDEAEQKANDYWERMLRMQAETDNLHRRVERDIANAHKYALEKFTLELLPIIDSLELCVGSAVEGNQRAKSIIEGVALTLKMIYAAMEKFGIEQVDPINQPFEPEHYQAISMQYDPEATPGTVINVLQKGYLLNKRLLRPALVIVATGEAS